jgi:predicted signal transduction protein with EAL and GGDEF domain
VVGAEALARWQHPELGQVPPDEFIAIAEQSGLIGELTSTILHGALRQARAWLDLGLPLRVSVNLSPGR